MTHSLPKTLAALLLVALPAICGVAQSIGQAEPPTDEASLRRILSTQPDHTAVQQFLFNEGFGGFGATSRVMKLGRRTRSEEDGQVFISEPGKPAVRLYPKRKEYAEVPADPQTDDFAFAAEEMAASDDVTFKLLGAKKVGEYDCRQIEVRHRDERLKELRHVFCVAPGLKNLIVAEQRFMGPVTMTTVLSDVRLGSPAEELFRVPAGYKKIVEKSPAAQSKELLDRLKKKSGRKQPNP